MVNNDIMYLRRLIVSPRNHQALVTVASPILKKVKWNQSDLISETIDEQGRVILERVTVNKLSDDGVFH